MCNRNQSHADGVDWAILHYMYVTLGTNTEYTGLIQHEVSSIVSKRCTYPSTFRLFLTWLQPIPGFQTNQDSKTTAVAWVIIIQCPPDSNKNGCRNPSHLHSNAMKYPWESPKKEAVTKNIIVHTEGVHLSGAQRKIEKCTVASDSLRRRRFGQNAAPMLQGPAQQHLYVQWRQ